MKPVRCSRMRSHFSLWKMMRLASCVLIIATVCGVRTTWGQAEQGAALLDRMVSAYESAERLQAEFSIAANTLTSGPSSGTVYLERSCCLRVALGEPVAKVFLSSRDARYEYFPDENKAYQYRAATSFRPAEIYDIFLHLRQYLAYVRPDGVENAEDGLRRLCLEPVESIAQVAGVVLDIDPDSGFVHRAFVKDSSGNELLRIRVENYKQPAQWPEGFFTPPADARIYTPMIERDFLNSDR